MNKPILSVLPGPGLCALGKRFPAYVTQERFLGVSGWKLFGTLRKSSGVRRDVLEANLAARDRVAIFAGDLRLPELLALRLLEGLGYHLEPALLVGPEEVGHVVDTDPELALILDRLVGAGRCYRFDHRGEHAAVYEPPGLVMVGDAGFERGDYPLGAHLLEA